MRRTRWKLFTSLLISLVLLVLAYLNRQWLLEAFELLGDARLEWLLLAMGLIPIGYLMSAQVFNLALRSLGYRMNLLRLWAIALVAIIISQSVPAGGVGSYAFLISTFNRRGISQGQAALIASLETISYVTAMLMMFAFSLIVLALQHQATGEASYIAGSVAIALVGGAFYVLTRPGAQLRAWLARFQRMVSHLLRHPWKSTWLEGLLAELIVGRRLLASRRRDVIVLVLIQLTALITHSLAMLCVLWAFEVEASLVTVIVAFGIALITSTFNVLPGGGGTVEAALVATLLQLGVGPAAVPAAIIFRLFNYWLLTPVAAGCYYWLTHEPVVPLQATHSSMGDTP
ncbi:lysylphosphatidylglycerol synthase transmembrane domain-containing protein [Candidatus Chloroploca sp. Khr17]|uniref:lysylphosphatidylglycerol synthase transmembrane domain-containing protein n=1 Tax=Candidatus Chloroploca sp. Khr17 TaxID=2496869 RepID=UPI00101D0963|nr:lysylphosphatidylglycerol synthase transmembrane domain-containing protein [Candidatus Chloroploca sp. Khr17]